MTISDEPASEVIKESRRQTDIGTIIRFDRFNLSFLIFEEKVLFLSYKLFDNFSPFKGDSLGQIYSIRNFSYKVSLFVNWFFRLIRIVNIISTDDFNCELFIRLGKQVGP